MLLHLQTFGPFAKLAARSSDAQKEWLRCNARHIEDPRANDISATEHIVADVDRLLLVCQTWYLVRRVVRAPASTIIVDKVSLAPIMINGRWDSEVEGLGMKMWKFLGSQIIEAAFRRK